MIATAAAMTNTSSMAKPRSWLSRPFMLSLLPLPAFALVRLGETNFCCHVGVEHARPCLGESLGLKQGRACSTPTVISQYLRPCRKTFILLPAPAATPASADCSC